MKEGMPSKQLLIAFAVGLAVVAVAIGGVLLMQRGAHIELKGAILKIRTAAMDEHSCVAVVDFRFANPASYPFVVRTVDISIVGADGNLYRGKPVSEVDAKRLFEFYKLLGQKYNDSLLMRDKIGPRQTQDRMIAARFEFPEPMLEARQNLKIRIEDVDGPVSELAEK